MVHSQWYMFLNQLFDSQQYSFIDKTFNCLIFINNYYLYSCTPITISILEETSVLKYTFSRSCSHLCMAGRKECFPCQLALFPSFEYYSFCSAHRIILYVIRSYASLILQRAWVSKLGNFLKKWKLYTFERYRVSHKNSGCHTRIQSVPHETWQLV